MPQEYHLIPCKQMSYFFNKPHLSNCRIIINFCFPHTTYPQIAMLIDLYGVTSSISSPEKIHFAKEIDAEYYWHKVLIALIEAIPSSCRLPVNYICMLASQAVAVGLLKQPLCMIPVTLESSFNFYINIYEIPKSECFINVDFISAFINIHEIPRPPSSQNEYYTNKYFISEACDSYYNKIFVSLIEQLFI